MVEEGHQEVQWRLGGGVQPAVAGWGQQSARLHWGGTGGLPVRQLCPAGQEAGPMPPTPRWQRVVRWEPVGAQRGAGAAGHWERTKTCGKCLCPLSLSLPQFLIRYLPHPCFIFVVHPKGTQVKLLRP